PIQSKWAGGPSPAPVREHWERNRRLLQGNLESLKYLTFVGGEPFLAKEIGGLLQQIIDAGVSQDVTICVVTNGTTTNAPWLRLMNQFKRLDLTISIDGFEKVYEYIRFPAKWDTLTKNIRILQSLPKANLSSQVTVQNYNALNLVNIFRFLDSMG